MSTLRNQIEYAWAGYGSTAWISYLLSDAIRARVTDNIRFYGQMEQVVIHYNNCKKECNLYCALGAARLVESRIDSINRGMPDLHPDIEQAIMTRAFEIHYAHGGTGVMAPSWVESSSVAKCDCFDKAFKERLSVPMPPQIKLTDDDFWFQERFE